MSESKIPEYGPDNPAAVITVHAFKSGELFVTSTITEDPDDEDHPEAGTRITELTHYGMLKAAAAEAAAQLGGLAALAESFDTNTTGA